LETWLIFAVAGLLAGFMAGLLGIGGGFIFVPFLLLVLPQIGLEEHLIAHFAIGTSLGCISLTSISSAYAHHKKGAIIGQLLPYLVPSLLVGSALGSLLAGMIAGKYLVAIFAIGALITASYLLSGHQPQSRFHQASKSIYFIYGCFTGIASALIGIGGGSILVPFLVYRGHPMVQSVATAALCGFPIALAASVGFIYTGWQHSQSIDYASGYIYWPALLGMVVFSAISAPLGAKLAHFVSERKLKQFFALFLIFSSGQIIYSHWL